jgi:hypothetical protein
MTFLLQPQTEFFTNIWGWLLEIYLWREPLSPVTLGPLWYVFWSSLRCCRKVRGFSSGCCCKVKLLFHIDTWYSGELVSEPFWASVSSLEEWEIWFRLNYFFHYEMAEVALMPFILLTIFFFISNVGEYEPRVLYMLGRHFFTELLSQSQISFFVFGCTGFELRALCLQSGTLLLDHITSPFWCGYVKGLCPCR